MQWCPRCQKNVPVNRSVSVDREKKERRTEMVCTLCHTTLKIDVERMDKKKIG